MQGAVAGQVVLGLATGALAWAVGASILRRRVAAIAEEANTGLALFWLGFGAVFVQSSALLLLGDRIEGAASGLLMMQLSAVAMCVAGGGVLTHAGYILRGHVRVGRLAAVWALVLGGFLVAIALTMPTGVEVGPGGPHVTFAREPPAWLGPTVGVLLAAPILVTAAAYDSARRSFGDSPARSRATLKSLALYAAATWALLAVVLAAAPSLARMPVPMLLTRMLALAAPALALGAEMLHDAKEDALLILEERSGLPVLAGRGR